MNPLVEVALIAACDGWFVRIDVGMICHTPPSLPDAMKEAPVVVDRRALNI
jgi:hypothetical protein